MALTKPTITITWPTAVSTKSVAAGGTQSSEEFLIDATAVAASVQVSGLNGGTPAAGDTLDVYVRYTLNGTDFDTADATHTEYLGQIDCTSAGTKRSTFQLNPCIAKAIIYVENNSAGRAITVSANGLETRAA